MQIERIQHARERAIEAAYLAGQEMESWRNKFSVFEKSRADLFTEADHASQEVLKAFFQTHFPQDAFLGEEDCVGRSIEEIRPDHDRALWIVDPIDGTCNYVHDVPAYCVSIGLWHQGELLVGVIYDPRLDEMFAAGKGCGATLNQKPIQVSRVSTVGQALISTGFPTAVEAQMRNVEAWRRVTVHCQALRRTGSTALNLAYVACGRFDAYWAFDNYPWDVAGGALLIQEAGGKVTNIHGEKFDPFRKDICASNGHHDVHDALVKLVTSE